MTESFDSIDTIMFIVIPIGTYTVTQTTDTYEDDFVVSFILSSIIACKDYTQKYLLTILSS